MTTLSERTSNLIASIGDMRSAWLTHTIATAKNLCNEELQLAEALSIRLRKTSPRCCTDTASLQEGINKLSSGSEIDCCYYTAFIATDVEVCNAYHASVSRHGVFDFKLFIEAMMPCL